MFGINSIFDLGLSLDDLGLGCKQNNKSFTKKHIKLSEFNQTVEFIKKDLQREIDLAKDGKNAGNFMCALSLLEYTKYAGAVLNQISFFKTYDSSKFFGLSLKEMEGYDTFNANDVYEILYNSLVYQDFYDQKVVISMLKGNNTKFDKTGISFEDDTLYFCIEKYFNDLVLLFKELQDTRLGESK
jgi:hypothetical protein